MEMIERSQRTLKEGLIRDGTLAPPRSRSRSLSGRDRGSDTDNSSIDWMEK